MSILADHWIEKMAKEHGMIDPFEPAQVRQGVISYGVSSYGYDFRLSNEFSIPTSSLEVLDPKVSQTENFEHIQADTCIIPPHSFVLAKTLEYFRIPRDVLTICFGKSTYARCGLFVNITPFEPEWEGYATISITNPNAKPAKIYAHEGIAQLLFLQSGAPCKTSYADKKGKYQAQQTITHAKL